jgi:hypothetical protein
MKWTGVLKSQDFQSRQSHSPGPQEAKAEFGPGSSQITPRHFLRVLKPGGTDRALREAAEDPLWDQKSPAPDNAR